MAGGNLRYGIIGGGFITAFQLDALRRVRGIEVAGITSKEPVDKLAAYIKRHGLGEGRVYGSVSEMVPHVDAAAIFAPNYARLEIMEEIADARKAGAGLIAVAACAASIPGAERSSKSRAAATTSAGSVLRTVRNATPLSSMSCFPPGTWWL